MPDEQPSVEESLPYALEIARQLHDARKELHVSEMFLRWDADCPPPVAHGFDLWPYLAPFENFGALRGQGKYYFLPRRKRRECMFHGKVCLPTREDMTHRELACHWYHMHVGKVICPTFLVDLLDPWPRDMTPAPKGHNRNTPLPPALRYYILQRDGFRCQLCGASPHNVEAYTLHVDHKQSKAHGGSDDPDNLLTLCERCNIGKGIQDL